MPGAERASTAATKRHRPRIGRSRIGGIFLGDVPAATAILDRFLVHATYRPDDREEPSAAAAHKYHERLRPGTRRRVSHTAHRRTRHRKTNENTIPPLRAAPESDDTHATYRVAGFQIFLSGRI